MKRFVHIYVAREDGDFDYAASFAGERQDLAADVIRELEQTEEILAIESDDEPVDVLTVGIPA